ncbi:hypothetical protein TNCV_2556421 [Trichonephila clavipes]|nr:hypothetical protein TNCV_2556421 [Trichonephila clavipes]
MTAAREGCSSYHIRVINEGRKVRSGYLPFRTNASTLLITSKRSSSRDVGTSSYRYHTATYSPASVSANSYTRAFGDGPLNPAGSRHLRSISRGSRRNLYSNKKKNCRCACMELRIIMGTLIGSCIRGDFAVNSGVPYHPTFASVSRR